MLVPSPPLRAARRTCHHAFTVLVVLVLLCAAWAPAAHADPVPQTNFVDSAALNGLTQPTAVRFSPDGRVFVAEKSGLIEVFDGLADPTPTTFADLRTEVYNNFDRGLLGLALDPSFPASPYIYVLYTRDAVVGGTAPKWGSPNEQFDPCPDPPGESTDGCVVSGRLARLTASGDHMVGSEQVLLDDWCQQFTSHSVGDLRFGPDGKLYVSAGEGAAFAQPDYGQYGTPKNPCGDPPGGVGGTQKPPTAEGGSLRAQDVRLGSDPVGLSGSLDRVDPGTGAGSAGNPLSGSSDANARRILAYGMRNPYRFAFRTGTAQPDIWIGDVGWDTWDELDHLPSPTDPPADNFGWPCFEGPYHTYGWSDLMLNACESLYTDPSSVVQPYFGISHYKKIVPGESCPDAQTPDMTTSPIGTVISGMTFYPSGGDYPSQYTNALFFADYARQCIWAMPAGTNGLPDPAAVQTFETGSATPVDLEVGPGGDLYYASFDFFGDGSGAVRRISYYPPGSNRPPTARVNAASCLTGETPPACTGPHESAAAPLEVQFDATTSSDPDSGDSLTYNWDLNGDGTYGDSTSATPVFTYSQTGTYTASVRVSDGHGHTSLASVTISVGNTHPTVSVLAPSPSLHWKVGDTINFAASAADAQDGPLPPSSFTWSLVLRHCPSNCHSHSLGGFPGVASGSFSAPDHGYPSHLELRVTATDSGGLSDSQTIRLDPKTVRLRLIARPRGLRAVLNGESRRTPFGHRVIVGSRDTLIAPRHQHRWHHRWRFTGWTDGRPRVHDVVPHQRHRYIADYRRRRR